MRHGKQTARYDKSRGMKQFPKGFPRRLKALYCRGKLRERPLSEISPYRCGCCGWHVVMSPGDRCKFCRPRETA